MLAVYNIVSIVISYILATPFFFSQFQRLQDKSADWAGWFWLKCCRRQSPSPDIHAHWFVRILKDEEEYSLGEILATTIGSIVISLSAPLFAGFSLYINHGRRAKLWWLIQQWFTRPRPTCLLFATQTRQAWIQGNKINQKRSRSALLSSVTAMVTDLFVRSLGLSLLRTEYKRSFSKSIGEIPSSYVNIKVYAYMLYIHSTIAIYVGGLITLPMLLLGLLGPERKLGLHAVWYIFWLFLWVPLVVGYAFSWCLWTSFLKSVPGELYCIKASLYINVVYCVLPVVLGVWRLAWAAYK
jgi:hypothetical protein